MNVIPTLLMSAAAFATPQPETVTLKYQDILTVSEHADTICPMTLDQSKTDRERARQIISFARERGYQGAKFVLLSMICTQWQKGYGEGARKGPVR